jgi:hypothetical protein
MPTTAKTLIYALGGGHGHARRGLLLQQHLAERGITSAVLLCPGADRHFPVMFGPRYYAHSLADPQLAPLLRRPPPHWIVDTFPHGWRGEISADWLARCEQTTWIARHARHLPLENLPAYSRILAPYPAHISEWDEPPARAQAVGYMIDAAHWRLATDRRSLAVLDPEHRCSGKVLALFARLARRAGLAFDHWRDCNQALSARKWLVIGAGYHAFYELLGLGIDARFLPINKRHDDQCRRAGLFERALMHLDQVLPWLDAAPPAPAAYTPPNWPALLHYLES